MSVWRTQQQQTHGFKMKTGGKYKKLQTIAYEFFREVVFCVGRKVPELY